MCFSSIFHVARYLSEPKLYTELLPLSPWLAAGSGCRIFSSAAFTKNTRRCALQADNDFVNVLGNLTHIFCSKQGASLSLHVNEEFARTSIDLRMYNIIKHVIFAEHIH